MKNVDGVAGAELENAYAQSVLALVRDVRAWEPLVAFDPVDRRQVRLNTPEHEEAWLLTWLPGQATPWHDHEGSPGSFVVVRGELCEQVGGYRSRVDLDAPTAQPDSAAVIPAGRQASFPSRHLHRMVNASRVPAVSLHVNAPRLESARRHADDIEEALMTPAEVAAYFRVNPKTVTRWSESGKLTSVRTLGGHRRFRASEVRALRREEA